MEYIGHNTKQTTYVFSVSNQSQESCVWPSWTIMLGYDVSQMLDQQALYSQAHEAMRE